EPKRVARERSHVLNGRQVIMPQSGSLENEPQREKCQHSTEASCRGQFPACGTSARRWEKKNAKANGNSEKNAFNRNENQCHRDGSHAEECSQSRRAKP